MKEVVSCKSEYFHNDPEYLTQTRRESMVSSESSVDSFSVSFLLFLSCCHSYSTFMLPKNLQNICLYEMGSKSGFMRGFQKGITLDDKTSRSVNLVGLQNRVAKKLQNFCI